MRRPLRDRKPDGRVAAQLTNTVSAPSPAGLKTLWACKPCGTHVRKADPASRDKQPGRLISTKFSIPYGIKNPTSALSEKSVCRTGCMCTGPNSASGLPTTRSSIPCGTKNPISALSAKLVCRTVFMCAGPNPASGLLTTRLSIPYGAEG